MSEFNTIARRPHVPREMEIQGLLKDLGITLPKRIPLAIHESDEEASFGEEDAESESEEEEDQLVEPSSLPILIDFSVSLIIMLCYNNVCYI